MKFTHCIGQTKNALSGKQLAPPGQRQKVSGKIDSQWICFSIYTIVPVLLRHGLHFSPQRRLFGTEVTRYLTSHFIILFDVALRNAPTEHHYSF